MIKSIRSDQKSFKAIHFTSGLNVVLAERKDNSSNKDSRNGLGKSTLIDIIHFCLASSGSNLRAPELKGWTFIMELILGGNEYTVSRNTEELNKLWLEGDFSKWPIQPEIDSDNGKAFMKPRDWCLVLGFFMFGLSVGIGKQKYAPTFRSLISYFGRSGLQAFGDPFKHFNMQSEWDKQVHNAFLLALNWEYASEFQKLKDEEKKIATFKSAADEGLLEGFVGTLGTLEAERITLDSDIEDFDQQIAAFNVHPQYYELQESANNDTQRIHELINRKVVSLAMLKQYRASISEESDVSHSAITKIYEEAGLFFPVATEKRIQDVLDFHSQVIKNRKSYLESEIQRLSDEVNEIEAIIETVSADRAKVLATLQAHGALDEYSRLQERLTSLREKREAIKIQIENLKKFEEGIENIAVEKKALRKEIEELREKLRKYEQNQEGDR